MTSSSKNGHLHHASEKAGPRVLLTPRDIIKMHWVHIQVTSPPPRRHSQEGSCHLPKACMGDMVALESSVVIRTWCASPPKPSQVVSLIIWALE